jgi:hypothetical protein
MALDRNLAWAIVIGRLIELDYRRNLPHTPQHPTPRTFREIKHRKQICGELSTGPSRGCISRVEFLKPVELRVYSSALIR